MKISFRPILGAFRVLAQRSAEAGRPGIGVWAAEGEKAASAARIFIRDAAHKDEVADLEAEKSIDAALEGLADGRVDPEDLANLARAKRQVRRSAEIAHDLGEVAS